MFFYVHNHNNSEVPCILFVMRCVDDEDDDMEDDDNEGNDNQDNDGELSNEEAARLMNSLRVKEEEDDEFEMAFKSLMLESVTKASAPKAAGSSGGGGAGGGVAFSGDRMGE